MNLVEFDLDFIRSFSSFRLHIFLALENKGEIRIQGEKKTPHAPHGFFPLSFKTFLFFFFFFLFPRIFSANALVAFSVSEKEAEVTKETGRQREEGFKSRKRKGRGLRAGMDFCFPSFFLKKSKEKWTRRRLLRLHGLLLAALSATATTTAAAASCWEGLELKESVAFSLLCGTCFFFVFFFFRNRVLSLARSFPLPHSLNSPKAGIPSPSHPPIGVFKRRQLIKKRPNLEFELQVFSSSTSLLNKKTELSKEATTR